MYKKTISFIIWFILFIWWINITSAASDSCLIQDAPAEVLSSYIQNVRKAAVNINSQIMVSDNTDNQLKTFWKDVTRIFNEIIDWTGYFETFEYFVFFPLENHIPYQFNRDYSLIEREWNSLKWYLRTLTKNGQTSVKLTQEQACKWIENCTLSWTPTEIIGKLVQNNNKILSLYRNAVMWNDLEKHDLILVDVIDFPLELVKNYGFDNLALCPDGSEWFLERIKEAIQKIELINKKWRDGIQKWKDAYALLLWKDTKDQTYQEFERQALLKELSRQWVSVDNRDIMMKNLAKYNQEWWYSKDNNFITNSIKHIENSVWSQINAFQKSISGSLNAEKTEVSIGDLLQSTDTNKITDNIRLNISNIYNTELPFTAIEEINTEQLRARIIQLHNNLSTSIDVLDETSKISTQVCNSQDKWNGKCN